MSDDMPEQPKTTQLAAVPEWAIELTRSMKEGFRVTNANIEVVSNDLTVVKDRLVIVERWKGEQDERASRMSTGVRGLSSANLEQDAQLAQERAAREALASKVQELTDSQAVQLAILTRLDKVASNPTVKVLLFLAGTAATGYLATKGISK